MTSQFLSNFITPHRALVIMVGLSVFFPLNHTRADEAPSSLSSGGDYILVGGELQARMSEKITDDIFGATPALAGDVTPASAESEDAVRISISGPEALALAPDGGLYVGAGSVIWRVLPDNTTYPLIGMPRLLIGGTDTNVINGSSGGVITGGNITVTGNAVLTFGGGGTLISGDGIVLSPGGNYTVWSGNSYYGQAGLLTITGTNLLRPLGAPSAGEFDAEAGDPDTGVSGTTIHTDFGPFQNISALAYRSGTLYAADAGRNAIYAVHAPSAATGVADPAGFNGAPVWSHIAGLPGSISSANITTGFSGTAGSANGIAQDIPFDRPAGLALAPDGTLYVADLFNSAIRTVTPGGAVSTLVTTASFAAPAGLDISADGGTLYLVDAGADAIQTIALSSGSVITYPAGSHFYFGAGVITNNTEWVAINGSISDPGLRLGEVTTIAGVSGSTGCTEGAAAGTLMNFPWAVARADSGNLYVADSANHRILEITPSGTTRTLAGSPDGEPGFLDAAGTAARFYYPRAIVLDATGTLHVADHGNNAIRRISPAGDAVTTVQLTLAKATGTRAANGNTNFPTNNTGDGGNGGGGAPALPSLALLAALLALRTRKK
jgi:streptogramin lyase